MTDPRVLVTGATGRTGAAVTTLLLAAGTPVRAAVRQEDARSDRLRAAGADVVVTDLFDPSSISRALVDVQRAYYVPPWHPYMVDSAAAFAAAAHGSRLDSLVWMTQWLAHPSHPSPATRQHALIDQIFRAIPNIGHTIINPGYFADNYLRVIDFAAHLGLFPSPTGDSRNAPPSNEDIARVIASVLVAPGDHDGHTYRPTGPELLTAADMANKLATVLNRNVRHWDLPESMFLKATSVYKVNPIEQLNVVHYLNEHRHGTFELGAPNDDIAHITGAPAETFEATATRYATLPFARPTALNRGRMLARFMRIGITPTPNSTRLAHRLGMPVLADATYSIDSPKWRADHRPTNPTHDKDHTA